MPLTYERYENRKIERLEENILFGAVTGMEASQMADQRWLSDMSVIMPVSLMLIRKNVRKCAKRGFFELKSLKSAIHFFRFYTLG